MLSRFEPRQRNYTELCNRSSTSSPGIAHMGSRHTCDLLEDYWEDASVSLRSCHSWDATSSPLLGCSASASSADEKTDEENDGKRFSGFDSLRIRPRSYSFDASEHAALTHKARRSFPPPLASCSTLSIKEGGRFVLKEMDGDRPQGFFRAQRGNGRLRLELILPDEDNEEEESSEESSSPVEGSIECVDPVELGAHVEEAIRSPHGEGMRSNSIEKVGSCEGFDISEDGLWDEGSVCKVGDFETARPTVQNVVLDAAELNVCSTSQDIGMDARYVEFDKSTTAQQRRSSSDGFLSDESHRDTLNCGKEVGFLELDSYHLPAENFLAFGKLESNHFVADSSNCNVEQEPLWNVDARSQTLAGLNRWSINLHRPIACLRPVLGLAMS